MKILILNMDQEQQLIAGVESFSKENSFILAVTVWQIGDRLVQESLFMLLVNLRYLQTHYFLTKDDKFYPGKIRS